MLLLLVRRVYTRHVLRYAIQFCIDLSSTLSIDQGGKWPYNISTAGARTIIGCSGNCSLRK